MAKREMLCPFSGRLCKNCSAYIGRHYLLCYKPGYRGHLKRRKGDKAEGNNHRFPGNHTTDFNVPEFKYREDLDPFTRIQ